MRGCNRMAAARGAAVSLITIVISWSVAVVVPPPAMAAKKPNVVLVLTDDQPLDTLQKMPAVRHLARRGMEFRRAFVSNSLCCPSRATLLTGLSAGHTGVWTNGDGNTRWGGWPAFRHNARRMDGSPFAKGDNELRTLAVFLHKAGYRTGLFGKYLNNYRKGDGSTPPIPAGWSSWHSFIGTNAGYYNYFTSDQGVRHYHGTRARDYSTDVFGRQARRFLRSPDIQAGRQPFFLYYAPFAPHGRIQPAARFAGIRAPRGFETRAYNERRVRDKPAYVRNTSLIGAHIHRRMESAWDRLYGSLRSVDLWVRRFRRALPTRVLHRTIFIFTSDNGFQWGDHRLNFKAYPYERSIRVPLIFAGPRIVHGRTRAIAVNADLTPTILDMVGIRSRYGPFDGRSLKPVLTGTGHSRTKAVLLEHLTTHHAPSYCGLRTGKWKYIVYRNGFSELYNLRHDPFELTNVARRRPQIRHRMHTHAVHLCRPRPPDW
jgi:N-acetylglucosamine-6-sulfatase